MASPPAKRQRRLTALSSDDEEEAARRPVQPSIFQPARRTLGRKSDTVNSARSTSALKKTPTRPTRRTSAKSTPTTSPEKAKSKPSTPSKGGESKSLHSFFQAVTEEQRWQRQEESKPTAKDEFEVGDDLIEDDSLDEAFLSIPDVGVPDTSILDQRKQPPPSSSQQGAGWGGSQKFLKPTRPKKEVFGEGARVGGDVDVGHWPWADRYAPQSLDELAVHKKKVADVQRWLVDAVAGRDRHVRILGPHTAENGQY